MNERIKIGVSGCLLGEAVRYNGGHKRDRFVADILAEYVDFVSICPEVGIGLGTPRPTLRLVRMGAEVRVQGTSDASVDVTSALAQYAQQKQKQIATVSGYIFKSRSPSCGAFRVKTYTENGMPDSEPGIGKFAETVMAAFPNLPIEEEGRLNDAPLRENFVERVFVYSTWREMLRHKPKAKDLVKFHTQHKYLIMAHSQAAYQRLGRMVASVGKSADMQSLLRAYEDELMQAMKRRIGPKRHANVLQHMLGYFKNDLDSDDKHEVLQYIDDYSEGLIPILVPLTLIKHYVRKFDKVYLADQVYLDPYPWNLMLRSVVGV